MVTILVILLAVGAGTVAYFFFVIIFRAIRATIRVSRSRTPRQVITPRKKRRKVRFPNYGIPKPPERLQDCSGNVLERLANRSRALGCCCR